MHVRTASGPSRRLRTILIGTALAVVALTVPSAASATVYTYKVKLSEQTQSATGIPGDPGGRGTSYITMDTMTNQVCSTTTWSGIDDPVGFGHIHYGGYGEPENPAFATIDLFPPGTNVQSGVSHCTTVLPGQIEQIAACPSKFNVVIHSSGYPVAAIRGQLPGKCVTPPLPV